MSDSSTINDDTERTLEFEFVRATENAALNAMTWLGKGDKNGADAAACDAIYGIFDRMDCCASVMIGEGIKDAAPGIFLGEKLGRWTSGSPHFDIALDPVDGTTNIAHGLPNSISVIAASITGDGQSHAMCHLPSFYTEKLAWGPEVVCWLEKAGLSIALDDPLRLTLNRVATALDKPLGKLVVCTLNRPRNQHIIVNLRECGVGVRLITDGDITAALAPSMPDSGIDLYVGIGGATEAVLTAAALKTLGGDMLVRMWPRDEAELASLLETHSHEEIYAVRQTNDLVSGSSAVFCATGISDSPLLPGVKMTGNKAVTSSVLLRAHSRTVRYMRTVHDMGHKFMPLRSTGPGS
ncbi:fructose-bisphosphatase class II family protein [Prosthecobacter sp.]|uniref:fructose-bisphosphatase class II family protein n=1 Tax=Prosthecobacter sp. TaxID=1965333 RepID=UPI002AB836E6|nr:fructose-bisphosphatase class II family protein [Prosthecobacter sp.]MDZ4403266.1 fructose-bisphosphatase class II family protein [Prosthecobacter sp.]